MAKIAICSIDGLYRGAARFNPVSDYIENKKIGSQINDYLSYCVDGETQETEYTLSYLDECAKIVSLLNREGENCEVIIYCDDGTEINTSGVVFIGFDVCSENCGVSPFNENLLTLEPGEYQINNYHLFYEHLGYGVLQEYVESINEYGISNDESTARSIAQECNYAVSKDRDMFDGEENFRIYKIYLLVK